MTAGNTPAGAASHRPLQWHQINWTQAQRTVRRLQARIVKATQAGRWGKVKALQHLLTHSHSGKALAVRRVTENQGKHTPGVDSVRWDSPEKKSQAVRALRQRGYKPKPLRRTYIPKSNGSMRPLSIPTMTDRAMQALYLLALDPVAETRADLNSYGFRTERSSADAMGKCYILLGAMQSRPRWVLEGDIKSCFDRIRHEWLLQNVPMDKQMLRKWLEAGYVEKGVLFPTQEGTPQGGPISPVLANLTLDGLEGKLKECFPKLPRGKSPLVHIVRYADDFLITGRSKELLEQEVKPVVEAFLRERGLELSAEKTKITPMEEGLDFLGHNLRWYKGKYLAMPSSKSKKNLLQKVRGIIKGNAQAPAGQLIWLLNPVLRGWAEYHRTQSSKRAFADLDHQIFWMLWRWAKRRHPHRGGKWVKRKYFSQSGSRNWVFTGERTDYRGRRQAVQLVHMARTPIKRHIKIRDGANPYDPAWEQYFEQRTAERMLESLAGRKLLIHLWREQQGKCPQCQARITKESGWNLHHLVERAQGGKTTADNCVLLHPNCHQQVHVQGISLAKPGPRGGLREA
jgi:RNA-directed DNA polymerase